MEPNHFTVVIYLIFCRVLCNCTCPSYVGECQTSTQTAGLSCPQIQIQAVKGHRWAKPADPVERKCVERKEWCDSHYVNSMPTDEGCLKNSQGLISNCFHFPWSERGSTYLIVGARMPWDVAEQYCQAYDSNYHLVSFDDEHEAKLINDKFNLVLNSPEAFAHPNMIDLLGDACGTNSKSKSGKIKGFWLGIYYNTSTQTWSNIDGSKIRMELVVNGPRFSIRKKRSRSNLTSILHDFAKTNQKHQYNLYFSENSIHWHRSLAFPKENMFFPITVCRARLKNLRPTMLRDLPKICVAGFTCPSDKTSCYRGYGWKDSVLCNGLNDCPNGEDEDGNLCHSITAKHKSLKYMYISQPQTYQSAKTFCSNMNAYLPSIHDESDIDFIASLPLMWQKYAQANGSSELRSAVESKNDWLLYTGLNLTSMQQMDGSSSGLNVDALTIPLARDVFSDSIIVTVVLNGRLNRRDLKPTQHSTIAHNPFVCQFGVLTANSKSHTLNYIILLLSIAKLVLTY